jgi:hypothetical protein
MASTLERLSPEAQADPLSNAAFEIWFLQSGFPGRDKMVAAFAWKELRDRGAARLGTLECLGSAFCGGLKHHDPRCPKALAEALRRQA